MFSFPFCYVLLLFAPVIHMKEKIVLLSYRILYSLKELFFKVLDALIYCELTSSVRVVAKWMAGWSRNVGLILAKGEKIFFSL